MKRDKILIITNKDDPHVDGVIKLAIDKGLDHLIIRLNTEDFLRNCIFSFHSISGYSIKLIDSSKQVDSVNIKTVWYRRPEEPDTKFLKNQDIEEFATNQCQAILNGLYVYSEIDTAIISPVFSLRKYAYKIPQLKLAQNIGLNIPDSIITNDPNALIEFCNKHETISTKSLNAPNFTYQGKIYPIFNRVVKDKQLIFDNIESIKICPTYFQEYIDKIYDIRVIVIGNSIYAFSIDSQSNVYSQEDFRGAAAELLKHYYIQLPIDLQNQILKFIEMQGLRFSALDFILSKNGKYYFIENNPNGQWMWLEYATGFPLTEKMLNYLLNHE